MKYNFNAKINMNYRMDKNAYRYDKTQVVS